MSPKATAARSQPSGAAGTRRQRGRRRQPLGGNGVDEVKNLFIHDFFSTLLEVSLRSIVQMIREAHLYDMSFYDILVIQQ